MMHIAQQQSRKKFKPSVMVFLPARHCGMPSAGGAASAAISDRSFGLGALDTAYFISGVFANASFEQWGDAFTEKERDLPRVCTAAGPLTESDPAVL